VISTLLLAASSGTLVTLTIFSYIAKLLYMKSVGNVFRALADPTRRQILQELKAGELTAGKIGSRFSISGPSISRHLSILKNAGLVSERREANRIYYKLNPEQIANTVGDFLSAICPTQIAYRRGHKAKEA
jgi:DNA-binding transcriptional ArsR family regulator